MLRVSRNTIDKAKRIEAAGKFLEKSKKIAPNNRDFRHNRELKAQRQKEDAFMSELERTHSKVYTNPSTNFEYLRLKLLRPYSYGAMVVVAEESLRTEISKMGYELGSLYIDASNIMTDSFTMGCFLGMTFSILVGQGFGRTTKIAKDGYIAAIRNSNNSQNKLNVTMIRNNNLFNTKRDLSFVKNTDDALYETTRIQKTSVSSLVNQKYWYPTYFLTVDASNIEVLDVTSKYAIVRFHNISNINVNRMKDVETDETFDLVLPLTGVKFEKYTAMRNYFGEEVVRNYMKHRKSKDKLE